MPSSPSGAPVRTMCKGCDSKLPPKKVPGRGSPRKWCSQTCRVRYWEQQNPEKRRAKNQAKNRRRRARKLEIVYEHFTTEDVFERDEGICQLCGLPIDPELPYPHPDCLTIDHIIPLSKGGTHTLDNVGIAHWVCNNRKGDFVPD